MFALIPFLPPSCRSAIAFNPLRSCLFHRPNHLLHVQVDLTGTAVLNVGVLSAVLLIVGDEDEVGLGEPVGAGELLVVGDVELGAQVDAAGAGGQEEVEDEADALAGLVGDVGEAEDLEADVGGRAVAVALQAGDVQVELEAMS